MASHQEMQAERYELKYILPLSLKEPIRSFLASYLILDDYSAAAEGYAYPIHSIYFDSPSLKTYQATQNGDRNRFKLRMRYYNDHPGSPVFLEMKRRSDSVIAKTRCVLQAHALGSALAGDSSCVRPKDQEAYAQFISLMHQLQASPRAHVAYSREAWMSPHDNSVRVTMDQDVRVEPKFDLIPTVQMKAPVHPFGDKMVLELKYTNRFPSWFRDLVQTFHLMQSGGPKYSGGVQLYGEHCFMGDVVSQQQMQMAPELQCSAPSNEWELKSA
jgi:hypothetical protein